jgi:hypothetical protein
MCKTFNLKILTKSQKLCFYKKNYLSRGSRFEVFMVVKIQVEVFWVVMPCSVVVGYLLHGSMVP